MNYQSDRKRMVEKQIARRGIKDERVLEAFRQVPRHRFVPKERRKFAYSDGPLPIGSGQTISQPYIVALMTDQLRLTGEETVLEVGTGSGYQAAILAELAGHVHTIERHENLAAEARDRLEKLGYDNVTVHVGDGTLGLPEQAPYQAILVTAGGPKVPPALLEQLDQEGRLVMPVGGHSGQMLEVWTREGEEYTSESITPVAFVPLRGEHGW
jgi:protein-L-isoaspartate(D-aspartate) O-methyltransferase